MKKVALVSLNNGLSYKDVDELTPEEIARVADNIDQELADSLDPTEPREWTGAYLLAHKAKFGEWLVIG